MLTNYGWSDALQNDFAPFAARGLHPARVIAQHRGLWRLAANTGETEGRLSGRFAHEAIEGAYPVAGDWVAIETPQGSIRARARLNRDIDPRVVVGEHGWWQACAALGAPGYAPFEPDGANFNLLIGSQVLDPVSGTASHRAGLCELRRAG